MSDAVTLTVAEVAAAIGCSHSVIYQAVRDGQITSVGVGRAVRIPRSWLERRFADVGCSLEMRIETGGCTFT